MSGALVDPLLAGRGLVHGFGGRGMAEPADVDRPRQVHGTRVHRLARPGDAAGVAADAIVTRVPGARVGVVTADCVPVLLASEDGATVGAVHAGWRGLCAGVLAAGAAAFGMPPALAAIGPHVGPCCYEVDQPVLEAVRARFGSDPPAGAVRPGRPGHAWLDLGVLAARELVRAGVPTAAIGRAAAVCTACDSERFHSYRRDGPRAGRQLSFITASQTASGTLPGARP